MRLQHTVFVISDGTGVTGERVIRAALTQFDSSSVAVERVPEVRDEGAIRQAIRDAARVGATVLFSLVSPEHRRALLDEARSCHLTTIDLLGPLLLRFSEVLHSSPSAEPGLFHQLDDEYFRRIEAVDFALKHDDGKKVDDLRSADLVLVGVSRTSKTPLSVFLANRGWKIANVPIILNHQLPGELFQIPTRNVVALTARQQWLENIRRQRIRRVLHSYSIPYADPEHVHEELMWFRQIVNRGGWRVVDVTNKAIEETAAELVAIL
jgi:regulator of PEP synthase PpsR (kinase-PPPase family)